MTLVTSTVSGGGAVFKNVLSFFAIVEINHSETVEINSVTKENCQIRTKLQN